jgi:hypothetical protein
VGRVSPLLGRGSPGRRRHDGDRRESENRIKALEADVRFQADRADRAEKWLYKISVEIEQKFFSEDDSRRVQAPTSQARS